MISEETINAVKSAAVADDIFSFLSLTQELKALKGKNYIRVSCPQCGSRECFVHTNEATGKAPRLKCYVCNLSVDVIGYLQMFQRMNFMQAIRYLADRHGIDTDGHRKPEFIPKKEETKAAEVYRSEYIPVESAEKAANAFVYTRMYKYLSDLAEALKIAPKRVTEVARLYGVGGVSVSWRSDPFPVVFPYADAKGVAFAKICGYMDDGHRAKYTQKDGTAAALITTLDKLQGWTRKRPDIPLFGAHLAAIDGGRKIVAVVESEKTALVMSLVQPLYTWVAAGSMEWITAQNFTRKFAPFRNCVIRLIPDRNAVNEWDAVAEAAQGYGYDCKCLSGFICEEFRTPETSKADIADVIEVYVRKYPTPNTRNCFILKFLSDLDLNILI